MSDSNNLHVEPAPHVRGADPVQPVRSDRPVHTPGDHKAGPDGNTVAASTGGNLRAAYAQFVINPDTQDVVVRIRDSATDEVLNEMPSKQVQAMSAYLKNYTETLARHKAALHGTAN
jgi:hypothetical protein